MRLIIIASYDRIIAFNRNECTQQPLTQGRRSRGRAPQQQHQLHLFLFSTSISTEFGPPSLALLQVSLALLVLLRFLHSYSYFSSSRDRGPGLNLICTAGEEDRAVPEKKSRAKKKKTCVRPPATKKK